MALPTIYNFLTFDVEMIALSLKRSKIQTQNLASIVYAFNMDANKGVQPKENNTSDKSHCYAVGGLPTTLLVCSLPH